MTTCPRCGRENAEDARFCSSCGNSLVTRVSVHERRVVTALFADLARSTGLGESLDPEVVRGIVGRFFELAAREIAARGGTVEKFSGDAVMAVFGIPSAHEDDPERAVRAAMAIRDGLTDDVKVRIGIESGEVVVGDPFGGATMATGDAMNVAARLEQQAEPGDIVLGAAAFDSVRTLVEAEPLGDLALRGHTAPTAGWRVKAIASEVGRPRGVPGLEAPLTGRDEELALLLDAADRAKRERKAVLLTIFGVPGVGKSRLIRETSARLAEAGWQIVRGRCLPYGDGITYWPVAEMLRSLAGIDPDMAPDEAHARLRDLAPDSEQTDRLALALGFRTGDSSAATDQFGAQDIAYAFRRLVEHVAGATPLVLVFEDIHWAEPPLLDLIEYLAKWTRDAPLLICCPSRPELLDMRPSWGSGRMEATRISLEPLTEEEARSLLGALLTVEDLPAALRQRVLDSAEGNPLFVEEVVRMLIEEGVVEQRDGHWFANAAAANVRVPDSVEALIRARLDTLPAPERVVLQAASVVGRVFQQSAVAAVSPSEQGRPSLAEHLEDAMLRDLITEERAPDEPTFRFRHILIRDVAYNTLPKSRRAELHVGVGAWLRAWAGSRIDEFIEIEAYHLEQALRLRREVGVNVEAADVEAATAALLASARKAHARDDSRAVRTFAERGLQLEPEPSDTRLELTWLLVDALGKLGEFTRAAEIGARLVVEAAAAGRRDLEGRAAFAKGGFGWASLAGGDPSKAVGDLRRARDLAIETGDWFHLTQALEFLGYEGWWYGDIEKASADWRQMADVAREHGLVEREAQAVMHLAAIAGFHGDVAERRRLLAEAESLAERGGSRLTKAVVARTVGSFVAQYESAERGRELLTESVALLDELGFSEDLSTALQHLGEIEERAGNFQGALDWFKLSFEQVQDHIGFKPEVGRRMAEMMLALGDVAGAEAMAEDAVRLTGANDWSTVASTGRVLGEVRAAQGRLAEAEELLRKAIAVLEPTEFPKDEEFISLARFLARTGRPDEARELLARYRTAIEQFPPGSPMRDDLERQAAEVEALIPS